MWGEAVEIDATDRVSNPSHGEGDGFFLFMILFVFEDCLRSVNLFEKKNRG